MKKSLLLLTAALTLAAAPQAQAAESCPTTLRFADTGIEGSEELQWSRISPRWPWGSRRARPTRRGGRHALGATSLVEWVGR